MNSLTTYLLIAAVLFTIGLFGVLRRRSLIAMLISIELMLNAASINFLAFTKFVSPDPATGQIYVLLIMGVAAAEVAIALAIIISLYRWLRTIDIERADRLRG